MAVSWQVPRNCLAWILIAQLALILPHIERLPWWVLVSSAICACWRIMIYQGRWSMPPKLVKFIITVFCFFGIYSSYGSLVGMEPTVALLITGFCLKLLELSAKRDVFVLLFLSYFVAITAFLFSQSFLMACFIVAACCVITTGLVALHQHSYQQFEIASLKKGVLIVSQSIPVMVLLFIVFPRFEPLWNIPSFTQQAKTGITDTMSPGDISNLARSSELAFRAEFEDGPPARSDMYWRGLVLSEFDGRAWRQGRDGKDLLSQLDTQLLYQDFANPIRYRIIQEPSFQHWLFTLALAYSDDLTIRMVNDFRLIRMAEIEKRFEFSVVSDLNATIQPELKNKQFVFETQLPATGNPQSRQFAQQLRQQSGSDEEYINAVLQHFFQQEFIYTLKPPALGDDTIDEFLMTTRRGFCSHYAGTFVFLMRAVGIPARVVTGYMGGEINPVNGTVLVHQFDAHAWAEVSLPGEGWRRIDPTGAVSPDRIEFGLEAALAEEGSFLESSPLSPMRYRNISWLNQFRLQLDAFNYYWAIKVLRYDDRSQLKVLEQLLGGADPFRVALLLIGGGGLVLSLVAYRLLRAKGEGPIAQEVRVYLKLCKQLEKVGYNRHIGEGPIDFARRVAEQEPQLKAELLAASRSFVSLSYSQLGSSHRELLLKQFRLDIQKLQRQLR